MFLGNAEQIFQKFVDSPAIPTDVFELDGSDAHGSFLGDGQGGKNQPAKPKPKNIECELSCSLYEFYNGSLKTLKYSSDKTHVDGRTITKVDHEKVIEIKPGADESTVLNFVGEGNE